MRLTFRKKLLIIFVATILFICSITAIAMRNYNYSMKKNELYLNAKNQSIQIDNYISCFFEQIKNNVQYLSNDSNATNENNLELTGEESQLYSDFEKFGVSHLDTSYTYMGTVGGKFIVYPAGTSTNQCDPRKRPWYIQAINNPYKIIVSNPYAEYNDPNNAIVSASTTVTDNSGKITGVVGLDVNLNSLSKTINNLKTSDNSYTFLFTEDGTIIAHPESKFNFKSIKTLSTLGYDDGGSNAKIKYNIKDYNKLLKDKNSSFETQINGENVLISVYTSSNTGWKIATVIPESKLISELKNITYFMLLIIFCIIIASVLFICFISKKITKPISELTSLMQSVENGNLDVKTDIKTKDEFKILGDCFNAMIKKLKKNYKKLNDLNEQLAASEEEIRAQYDELQYNQEILRKSEDRYRLAIEGSRDSIWELDVKTDKFFISNKFFEMTGYPKSDELKLNTIFNVLIHPDDKLKAISDLEEYINNNKDSFYKSDFRIKSKDGSYIWVYNRGKASKDKYDKVVKIAGSTTNITERKKTEKKMLYMAHYDSLTNVHNRAYFMIKLNEQLDEAVLNKTESTIFFIDLDNFKSINDTMGHDFGDMLLKQVSARLMKVIKLEDIICRLGGDEFIILHPRSEKDEITQIADNLLKLFDKAFEIKDKQIYITSSIGIASFPRDGSDVNSILKSADAAMYKAKKQGRNRYAFYDEEIYLKLERKTHIQRILRTAIQNKELSVYYQPQYNSYNNEIYGFEALLRLNSKELGFISPAEFIPIAEDTGWINVIGKWVFIEACKQAKEWINKGFKFKSMAINISPAQLNQPDFFDMIKEIINTTKIEASLIEMEITETLLMKSIDSNIKTLNKLVDLGIRIALDDFGTGYSSLNYLRKIPLYNLKIDKSFIDNMSSNVKEEAIIENIIEMAHSMGLKVVAEGVENEQQLLTLKNIKCDFIQGYYFSKPLPPNKTEALMM